MLDMKLVLILRWKPNPLIALIVLLHVKFKSKQIYFREFVQHTKHRREITLSLLRF